VARRTIPSAQNCYLPGCEDWRGIGLSRRNCVGLASRRIPAAVDYARQKTRITATSELQSWAGSTSFHSCGKIPTI